ncbi:MAG: SDR family oxidoreductase [Acidobacteria bacterium]|nr:SDR family oxidoreductase [Acidobacteriota bacterium]
MELKDKVALLTGITRIGRTVALKLAEAGADIVLTYHRSRDVAEQTARGIESKGRRALAIQTDVSQSSQVSALVEQALAVFGGIDILVYMASVYKTKTYAHLIEEDWDWNLNVDLKGAYLCARGVEESMKARGGGRIINFADWIAASGRPRYKGYLPYYVAKRGVIGLTEALALELAPYNILVNCIAPGPILPPPDLTLEEDAEVRAATPLGRWGGAEEVAKVVLALIESDFITGECIRVDGGRHMY